MDFLTQLSPRTWAQNVGFFLKNWSGSKSPLGGPLQQVLTALVFGFTKNFYLAVGVRFMAGAFNGGILVACK